jgi:hypothetical protein
MEENPRKAKAHLGLYDDGDGHDYDRTMSPSTKNRKGCTFWFVVRVTVR